MTLLILENIGSSNQRKLFKLLGVDYVATSRAWIAPIWIAIFGIILSLIFAPVDGLLSLILTGLAYGFLIFMTIFFHDLGHILSSRMVKAPMQTIVLSATVNATLYDETEEHPSYVHIARALGGPVLNMLLGLATMTIYNLAASNHFLELFWLTNLILAGITMLPAPSFDGDVIVRELRDWKK